MATLSHAPDEWQRRVLVPTTAGQLEIADARAGLSPSQQWLLHHLRSDLTLSDLALQPGAADPDTVVRDAGVLMSMGFAQEARSSSRRTVLPAQAAPEPRATAFEQPVAAASPAPSGRPAWMQTAALAGVGFVGTLALIYLFMPRSGGPGPAPTPATPASSASVAPSPVPLPASAPVTAAPLPPPPAPAPEPAPTTARAAQASPPAAPPSISRPAPTPPPAVRPRPVPPPSGATAAPSSKEPPARTPPSAAPAASTAAAASPPKASPSVTRPDGAERRSPAAAALPAPATGPTRVTPPAPSPYGTTPPRTGPALDSRPPSYAPAPAAQPSPAPAPDPLPPVVTPPAGPSPAAPAPAAAPAASAAPAATPPLAPVSQVKPQFPREALSGNRRDVTLKVRLAIGARGEVTRVDFVDSSLSNRPFERAARDALQQWRFPEGAPDRSYRTEIHFKLE